MGKRIELEVAYRPTKELGAAKPAPAKKAIGQKGVKAVIAVAASGPTKAEPSSGCPECARRREANLAAVRRHRAAKKVKHPEGEQLAWAQGEAARLKLP